MRLARCVIGVVVLCLLPLSLFAQQLEIHYIDVGWGGSVLVKGPDGTTVLLEAGKTGKGTQYVVPYLKSTGVQPANGLAYGNGGPRNRDQIRWFQDVIQSGHNAPGKQ